MSILDLLMILRLQIGCLCFSLFAAIPFFTIKREKNFAHKLFRYIIIFQFISLSFDIITVSTVNNLEAVPSHLNKLLHIIFISSLCFFSYLTFLYIRHLVTDDNRKVRLFAYGLPLAAAVFSVIFAPLHYVETETGNYSAGVGANILYCIIGAYLLMTLYVIIRCRKSIDGDKRQLILIALLTEILISLIQLFMPTLLISGLGTTLVTLAIYFTIENPDRILGMLDPLTQIPNRRCFNRHFETEWKRALRNNSQLGFMIIDADNFKKYNDAYGHPQGDVLLKAIACIFKQSVRRPADMAARWGGEEFVVLLPETDTDGTYAIAENIRESVESLIVPAAEGIKTRITVSIGVTSAFPAGADTPEEFIGKADKALYDAKHEGRNRVVKNS